MLKAKYTSLELVEVVWRRRNVAVLRYRALSRINYPPGTFSMLWVPGHEAIPMTPLQVGNELFYIVKSRGLTTKVLVENPPPVAGAIGPLGRPAGSGEGRWLHVAGGTGVAASLSLMRVTGGTLAYGARSREELVPLEELGLVPGGSEVYYATEDGSAGYRGTVLDLAAALLDKRAYSHVAAAGPKPVLCGAAKLADQHHANLLLSPETMVRCGLGFCGRCSLGCGLLLCRDGLFLENERIRCWLVRECA